MQKLCSVQLGCSVREATRAVKVRDVVSGFGESWRLESDSTLREEVPDDSKVSVCQIGVIGAWQNERATKEARRSKFLDASISLAFPKILPFFLFFPRAPKTPRLARARKSKAAQHEKFP